MAAASAVAWGRAGRSVSRGLAPLPPPRPSKGAPPFPPSVSPLRGSPPSGNYSGGRGARSRAPRLRRGRLRAGRAPLHPRCLCGLPPGLWPCALRLPRRVRRPRPAARVAPVVWWSGASGEGGAILQREHRGTGTRLRRSDRRLTAAIWPKPRKKAPALTKSGGIGRFPTPKRPAERPKMGYGVPRSVRYGSIVPSLTA